MNEPGSLRYVTHGSKNPQVLDHLQDRNRSAERSTELTPRARAEAWRCMGRF